MEFTKYKNTMPYPERISKPKMPKNPTAKDAEDFAKDLLKYEEDWRKRISLVNAYNQEEVRLMNLFQEDLFLENVKSDNGVIAEDVRKKAEIIFSKAWEDGHANGFYEVEMHFRDLVDFAKELGVDI